jgi:glycerol kinase
MSKKYIISLDQGTTSSRAILFDHDGLIIATEQKEFTQFFPQPGWVEHDATEIWETQKSVLDDLMTNNNIDPEEVAAIGITNQRETTLVWDKKTGEPIHKAIVWQDRRTASYCDELKKKGFAEDVNEKTGLVLDAYFSGTKVTWLLDNVVGARERAEAGDLLFGTIDSWLVWKLTGGKVHITDVTNASRTMLFNIRNLEWDKDLAAMLNVPMSMLAEVKQSSEIYGYTENNIPIAGIAGDQQAALFGQMCTEPGMAKNTYGTGCFLVLNTGDEIIRSKNNLLSTIAWKVNGKVSYALEGSVFVAGAVIQWLRDGLELLQSADKSEEMAASVEDNGGVYFVPALTGLGAPYWDQYARGTIVGITRGTTKEHFVRAALESIAFQVTDVVTSMEADTGNKLETLKVDGGAVANNILLQGQADLLDCEVVRPQVLETTALGAAYLAGLAVGFWGSLEEIKKQWKVDRTFHPQMDKTRKKEMIRQWKRAVERSRGWIES